MGRAGGEGTGRSRFSPFHHAITVQKLKRNFEC